MIRQLIGALIGVDPDEWESPENQEKWQQQRIADIEDLDFEADDDDSDDDDDEPRKGWFGLW